MNTTFIQETVQGVSPNVNFAMAGHQTFAGYFEALTSKPRSGVSAETFEVDSEQTYTDLDGQQKPFRAHQLSVNGEGRTALVEINVHPSEKVAEEMAGQMIRATLKNPHGLLELGFNRLLFLDMDPRRNLNTWVNYPMTPSNFLQHRYRGGDPDFDFPVQWKTAQHETKTAAGWTCRQLIDEFVPEVVFSGHNSTVGAGGVYLTEGREQLTLKLGGSFRAYLPEVPPYGTSDLPMATLFNAKSPGIFQMPSYEQWYDWAEVNHPKAIKEHTPPGRQSLDYAVQVAQQHNRQAIGVMPEIPYWAMSPHFFSKAKVKNSTVARRGLWQSRMQDLEQAAAFQRGMDLEALLESKSLSIPHQLIGEEAYRHMRGWLELSRSYHARAEETGGPSLSRTDLALETAMSFYAMTAIGTTARFATAQKMPGHVVFRNAFTSKVEQISHDLKLQRIPSQRLVQFYLKLLLHTMEEVGLPN